MAGRITIEPGKRSARPCVCGLRITVWDVLSRLGAGISEQEIPDDYPELEAADFPSVVRSRRAPSEMAAALERTLSGIEPNAPMQFRTRALRVSDVARIHGGCRQNLKAISDGATPP